MRLIGFFLIAIIFKLQAGVFSQPFEKPPVDAVISYSTTVEDIERSTQFYTKILSFKKVADFFVSGKAYDKLYDLDNVRIRVVRLRLGLETLNLMQFEKPKGRSIPSDAKSNDQMFQHIAIVVSDINKAYGILLKNGVTSISQEPQKLPEWNQNASGIQSFYFKDPDGHSLEIIEFPPGKGNPHWQQSRGRIFLGIDHSAIGVKNTRKSLEFYKSILGLKVTGESFNYGPEQEKLSNVKEAKLLITSLHAERGPGIELLDYISPTTGNDMPSNTKANDLWYWQIRLEAPQLSKLHKTLIEANVHTNGILTFTSPYLDYDEAFLATDPDGHALLISH